MSAAVVCVGKRSSVDQVKDHEFHSGKAQGSRVGRLIINPVGRLASPTAWLNLEVRDTYDPCGGIRLAAHREICFDFAMG